jgi:MFS superfamily sulfate permease-like transporter
MVAIAMYSLAIVIGLLLGNGAIILENNVPDNLDNSVSTGKSPEETRQIFLETLIILISSLLFIPILLGIMFILQYFYERKKN